MTEKNKYRFKGHESFILREGWLNKGLFEIEKDAKVFSENYGADELGVGPNMAKSIRYWLKTMNLTEDKPKEGTKLTELGRIILTGDPYLEDIFTNVCKEKREADESGGKEQEPLLEIKSDESLR